MKSYSDNGEVYGYYGYDISGERVFKMTSLPKNGNVTFFNKNGVIMRIKYDDFKRMGNQEDIK